MTRSVTKRQQEKALRIVAEWLGQHGLGDVTACGRCDGCREEAANPSTLGAMACDSPKFGPAPTGEQAAWSAAGPMLLPEWDWPGKPTPSIVLEGGPDDWAVRVAHERVTEFRAAGIYAEPYSGWALCLYRED